MFFEAIFALLLIMTIVMSPVFLFAYWTLGGKS